MVAANCHLFRCRWRKRQGGKCQCCDALRSHAAPFDGEVCTLPLSVSHYCRGKRHKSSPRSASVGLQPGGSSTRSTGLPSLVLLSHRPQLLPAPCSTFVVVVSSQSPPGPSGHGPPSALSRHLHPTPESQEAHHAYIEWPFACWPDHLLKTLLAVPLCEHPILVSVVPPTACPGRSPPSMDRSTAAPAPAPHTKQYVFVDEYNRHKRLKVMRACDGCRKRKIRCDGAVQNGPWPCGACVRLKLKCVPPTSDADDEDPSSIARA
nr:hypothetical protein CFP56_50324 [Quercus suber]